MGDQAEQHQTWWQRIKQHPFITLGIITGFFALIGFTFGVYKFGWDWTGFTSGESKITTTVTSHGTTTAKELLAAKTLWDWLQLIGILAIPVVVGLGGAWFTTQQTRISDANREQQHNTDLEVAQKQHDTDLEIAQENQREAALQDYIDKISELLLVKHLRNSEASAEIRTIARLRTLTVLSRLDGLRKRSILIFLGESGLITINAQQEEEEERHSLIILYSADFNEANLSAMRLDKVYLRRVSLRKANLAYTTLAEANLVESDLTEATLLLAHLPKAKLTLANLSRADLRSTNLEAAELQGATLNATDLRGIRLKGANLW
ncbi:MAG: pentapeptide repeat-containing protein, partial [Ktedonobacteraceae bacterium]|nr:pentapeptide repeat-containing protein [Ktedonobacteraceae bacterium]